jgi:uncharacterized protein (DUF885 family)
MIDEYLTDVFEEHPVAATSLGADGYDHLLGDFSADGFARREEKQDEWLRRFGGLDDDSLTQDERIDRDLVCSDLRGDVLMRDWQAWRRSPDAYLGPCLSGPFRLFVHRLRPEAELAASAAARLRLVPEALEHGKGNLDPKLVPPVFVERALGSCRAGVAFARSMLPGEVSDPDDRERVAEAGEIAARAFEDFASYLEKLQADAAGDWAIGEERYSALLQEKELLGYGAREMHERGRAAYEELASEMRALAKEIGGSDDWRAVIEELNADHPSTPEAMREAYERSTAEARQFLVDRGLVTLPEGESCLVVPSPPFQRPVLAVASYMSPPAFKPSLQGHFFVPFPPDGASDEDVQARLADNNHHSIPTTAVHEAYPGHHWHLAWLNATNGRKIRKVVGSSYFVEGWALYAEKMMREEGFFTDPRDEFFHVEARLFRAARIVVDTALHLGEMTFDEAVTFMREKAGRTEPVAKAEVGRYCSWPTQAAAYLTGSLEIERIRKSWQGDLRTFHDTIAGSGLLPMALAERAIPG